MPQVIIGDIIPYTQATGTMGQTVFNTNWTANATSDIQVYYTPLNTTPNDVTQILNSTQYTVTFVGEALDVRVTLVSSVTTTGDIITIVRNTPADRMNLYSNTNFVPEMLNQDFGILTLVDQQAQLVNQLIAPRYNYSAQITDVVDTILPILGPNEFWVKNGSNTGITTATAGAAGSGNVSPGVQNQMAYYAFTGTTVAPLANPASNGLALLSGPTWSTFPPITKILIHSFTNTGSNTYTPSVGLVYATVEVQAGGGAGGSVEGAIGKGAASAGGGGGGFCRKICTAAQIGATATAFVGIGGVPGAAGNHPGGSGGSSVFTPTGTGPTLSATGGNGGTGMAASATTGTAAGGVGGDGSNGDINSFGGEGGDAILIDGSNQFGLAGCGGNSYYGGGTGNSVFGGYPGNPYGGGASGYQNLSTSNQQGLAGYQGIIVITEYISI